jgi:hypothetical protein
MLAQDAQFVRAQGGVSVRPGKYGALVGRWIQAARIIDADEEFLPG